MTSHPCFLEDLEEGIGNLEHVSEQDGLILAQFKGFSLLLPFELKKPLSDLAGHRIGVFRIDGSYRIRVDEGKKIDSLRFISTGGR